MMVQKGQLDGALELFDKEKFLSLQADVTAGSSGSAGIEDDFLHEYSRIASTYVQLLNHQFSGKPSSHHQFTRDRIKQLHQFLANHGSRVVLSTEAQSLLANLSLR